jgi:hypothetical protein
MERIHVYITVWAASWSLQGRNSESCTTLMLCQVPQRHNYERNLNSKVEPGSQHTYREGCGPAED